LCSSFSCCTLSADFVAGIYLYGKFKVDSADFFTYIGKAFLDDKDAQPDKLARYYEYVVK